METRKYIIGMVALGALSTAAAAAPTTTPQGTFNEGGNILISDQFNNRVIEVDKKGQIVWQWGLGPNDVSANSIVGVNDAERVGQNTLMAGTGAPPNSEPLCSSGCADNRVILVDPNGNILWQYGQFGVTGSAANELNAPVQATYAPNNTVFITDQGNERVIEVDKAKNIVWQYGTTGTSGSGVDQLNNPNSAELLGNGDVLIADEGNNRVIEVNKATLHIVKTFTIGGTSVAPAFASRLPNGETLIADGGNNRIVTVNGKDQIVFEYFTDTQSGSNPNPAPSRAVKTMNGEIVISDQFNHRVIVIDKKKNIRAQYGVLNAPGYGATATQQGLNAPYDAKVIGDYTGLTQP
jgi:hypothetical protein